MTRARRERRLVAASKEKLEQKLAWRLKARLELDDKGTRKLACQEIATGTQLQRRGQPQTQARMVPKEPDGLG